MLTASTSAIPEAPAVLAIYPQTDAQRSAYRVVDAIDALQHQLGAYRALEQLTINNVAGSPESLEQLQRADLAVLLGVLNANTENHLARVREAAVAAARDNK